MRYVVDSCVALKWELPEVESSLELQLRDLHVASAVELVAPDILPLETAHALTRAERRGIVIPPNGALALQRIVGLIAVLFPSLSVLSRAYDISSAARIGVYDCIYLALAEKHACKLITTDARLRIFPQVVLLSDFPFSAPAAMTSP